LLALPLLYQGFEKGWFGFRLEQIFATAPAAALNILYALQKWSKMVKHGQK